MLAAAIGGLVAGDHAIAAADHQKNAIMQVIAKLDSVGMPPDQSAALVLAQFQQQGILTPQLEAMIGDSVSEFSKIKGNASLRDTQMKALQQMSKYGKAGLTPEERAEMNQSRQGVQRDLEAKNQQIAQEFQARGMGGAGQEMAQRLLASQAGADRASEEGDRISSLASQRALQAIAQSAGMAGQLRSQDFGEESAKADAVDQMQRFNVQNQMALNQRNVQAANQAQAGNLALKQSVADKNVTNTNEEKYDQLNRQRQFWDNKLRYAQAYTQPLMNYGDVNAGTEMQKGRRAAAIGTGIDNAIKDVFGLFMGQAPKKTESASGEKEGPTNENAQKQDQSFGMTNWSSLMGGK